MTETGLGADEAGAVGGTRHARSLAWAAPTQSLDHTSTIVHRGPLHQRTRQSLDGSTVTRLSSPAARLKHGVLSRLRLPRVTTRTARHARAGITVSAHGSCRWGRGCITRRPHPWPTGPSTRTPRRATCQVQAGHQGLDALHGGVALGAHPKHLRTEGPQQSTRGRCCASCKQALWQVSKGPARLAAHHALDRLQVRVPRPRPRAPSAWSSCMSCASAARAGVQRGPRHKVGRLWATARREYSGARKHAP